MRNIVAPTGFEPVIYWLKTSRPGPLDEGAMLLLYTNAGNYWEKPHVPACQPAIATLKRCWRAIAYSNSR